MRWGINTWGMMQEKVTEQPKSVAVWGWGAIEQHGPRMPLDTDFLLADYFASHLNASRPSALVLPTLAFGMSGHHAAFPGTITLSNELAVGMAMAVLRSVYAAGIRKIYIILGHGGNVKPYDAAVMLTKKEFTDLDLWEGFDDLFYTKEGGLGALLHSFGEEISHAGATEASLIYAVLEAMGQGSLLDRYLAIPIEDSAITYGAHGVGTQGASPEEFRRRFPTGSKGNQKNADLEKGRQLLRLFEEATLSTFDAFAAGVVQL